MDCPPPPATCIKLDPKSRTPVRYQTPGPGPRANLPEVSLRQLELSRIAKAVADIKRRRPVPFAFNVELHRIEKAVEQLQRLED